MTSSLRARSPEVLGHCRKNYDLIVVNAEDRDADLLGIIGARRLPFLEDKVYKPSEANRLFADVANHLSFIPSVVIRRDLWLSRDRKPYFGSLFVHVGVIFQDRLPGDALVVARPLVAVRNANVSWASRSFEIWMFKWPGLIWSLPGFSRRGQGERLSPGTVAGVESLADPPGHGVLLPGGIPALDRATGSPRWRESHGVGRRGRPGASGKRPRPVVLYFLLRKQQDSPLQPLEQPVQHLRSPEEECSMNREQETNEAESTRQDRNGHFHS